MLSTHQQQTLRRKWIFVLAAALAEAVFCLAYLLLISRSEKNAWLLGYSKTRLFMTVPFWAAAGLAGWAVSRLLRRDAPVEKMAAGLGRPLFQVLADACAVMAPMGAYLLVKWNFFIDTGFDYQTVVQRLNPYLLLLTLYALGFLIAFYPRPSGQPSAGGLVEKLRRKASNHRALPLVLLVFALLFVAAHFAGWTFQNNENWKWSLLFFAHEFNLDNEQVLPAFFSGFLLLLAGLLALAVAADHFHARARFRWHWGLLALAFFYLGLDEMLHLHENWSLPGADLISGSKGFFFAWVPSAIVLMVVFGLVFLPFFLNLPRRAQVLFLAAGVLYVGGALGMELVASEYMSTFNDWGYDYWRLVAVEEGVEMLGVIVAIHALLQMLGQGVERARAKA